MDAEVVVDVGRDVLMFVDERDVVSITHCKQQRSRIHRDCITVPQRKVI